ncbi:hypothetical protein [Aquimarina aggregata]|uniref:hypothetical protein n=1 Tax=Aquimarina aggregata TaxID=1642818 RepID=UPI00248F6EC2|nr:hypothetical protein [Aquimarina aggregata]
MQTKISMQFATDFKNVNDNSLDLKVKDVLQSLKNANKIDALPQFRKIDGATGVYKMSIGFYILIGVITSEDEITLSRFLHRNQIANVINKFK